MVRKVGGQAGGEFAPGSAGEQPPMTALSKEVNSLGKQVTSHAKSEAERNLSGRVDPNFSAINYLEQLRED